MLLLVQCTFVYRSGFHHLFNGNFQIHRSILNTKFSMALNGRKWYDYHKIKYTLIRSYDEMSQTHVAMRKTNQCSYAIVYILSAISEISFDSGCKLFVVIILLTFHGHSFFLSIEYNVQTSIRHFSFAFCGDLHVHVVQCTELWNPYIRSNSAQYTQNIVRTDMHTISPSLVTSFGLLHQ